MADLGNFLNNGAGRAQRNDRISLGAFLASLTVSFTCLVAGFLIFLFLKDRLSRVYQPRFGVNEPTLRAAPLPRGPFKWLLPVLRTSDEILLEVAGIDAFFFLRLLYVLVWMTAALSIVLIPILLTINLLQSHGNPLVQGMNQLSWASTQDTNTSHYWASLVCAMIIPLVCCLTVYHELVFFVKYRQHHMRNPAAETRHCVLVRDIPKLEATETHLRACFEGLSPLEIWLDRDFRKMRALREKGIRIRDTVEISETSLIRKAVYCAQATCLDYSQSKRFVKSIVPQSFFEILRLRPTFRLGFPPLVRGKKVDKIQHLMEKLDQISRDFHEIEKAYKITRNAAILRFSDRAAAQAASRLVLSTSPWSSGTQLLEIDGNLNNIEWEHLSTHHFERAARRAAISVICVLLTVGWAVPIACVSSLSQLSLFYEYFEWANWVVATPSWVLALLQGVLPQAGCTALMMLFPLTLRCLLTQRFLATRADLELQLQQYYFSFLYLHLFLTVSMSSGLTAVLYRIVKSPRDTPMLLAQNLPKASNYFLSYLLLQAFTVSATMLSQASSLFLRLFAKYLDKTVRQKWQRRSSASQLQWGTLVPIYTNLGCIVIIYAPIAPIILPIGFTTFGCFWVVYRYSFLYLKARQVQTGGLLYLQALFQLFTGIYTMELCVLGLFLLARDASGTFICIPHSVIMGFILALTGLFHYQLKSKFLPLVLSSIQYNGASGEGSEDTCNRMIAKAATPMFPHLWLPDDDYGVCDNEIKWLHDIAPEVPITNICAAVARDGRLNCSWPTESKDGSTKDPR